MNKIKIRTGVFAVMAIIAFIFAACGENPGDEITDPCEQGHAYSAWVEPTCTTEGNSERTCSRCNNVDIRVTGYAALGHTAADAVTATCTKDGSIGTGTCTREGCGQVIDAAEIIPAFGHSNGE